MIENDAAADGVPARWCWASFWWPFAGTVVLAVIFVVVRPFFYTVQLEDQAVEWAQFTMCAFAAAMSFLAAITFARGGRPGLALLMTVTGLGMLGLTGEEISWGQRVFGVVTPEELGSVNHQAELNLHNINVGVDAEDLFKAAEFVMGMVAAALAFTTRPLGGRLRRSQFWLIAPPLFTLPGFLAIAAYRALMIIIPVEIDPLVAFQEYAELTLYFSLAATAACYYLRARNHLQARNHDGADRPARIVPFVLLGAGLVAVTVVFAILSARSGILPGNLPGMST